MATQTSLGAQQVRIRQWAEQIRDCQNRPEGMDVKTWCSQNNNYKVQLLLSFAQSPVKHAWIRFRMQHLHLLKYLLSMIIHCLLRHLNLSIQKLYPSSGYRIKKDFLRISFPIFPQKCSRTL